MIHSDDFIIYKRDHRLKIRKLPHDILRNTASGLEIQIIPFSTPNPLWLRAST